MRLEEHCASSLEKFGEDFKEVHQWLDYSNEELVPRIRNRARRHHKEGLIELEKLFSYMYYPEYGKKAVEAAKQHIIEDFGVVPEKKDYDEQGFLHHPIYEKKKAMDATQWMS
jgi:hypothetical protein